jgi:glycosyltransferase involved in cell wall biosynthesis
VIRRRKPRRPDERREVLVLLDSIESLGGAEKLAVELAVGLDPERYRRTLCLTRDQSAFESLPEYRGAREQLEAGGVEVLELGRASSLSLRPWLRLIRFLRGRRVDVLHAHKFGSNAWGTLCGRLAGVPAVIAHEHMWSYTESSGLRRLVDRRLVGPGADALVAVSREGAKQMVEIVGVAPGHVTYIPNGVADAPPPDRARARELLDAGEDETIVCSVALLRPEKELGMLVEATAALRAQHPRIRTVIVGEGPERPALEALIERLGAAEAVTLAGYRDDVQTILPGCDLAVCCSRFEGGPLSVMEYMEAGLATVATRVGGLPEMLADGECGVLVEPGDAAALAAGIGSLLEDPVEREEIGRRAHRRKREVYSLTAWIGRMEDLYSEVLDRRGASAAQTSS